MSQPDYIDYFDWGLGIGIDDWHWCLVLDIGWWFWTEYIVNPSLNLGQD